MIANHSVVVATKEQTFSELDDETVILHLKSGVYYGLNAVGTTIWNLIQQPRVIAEIRDAMLTKYQVDASQCEQDLLNLLEELRTEGLIEVTDATVG